MTDRVFRGLCRPGVDYAAFYPEFESHHDEIHQEIVSLALLEENEREDVLDYLHEFWETLEDEGRARRRIEEACRNA